MPRRRDGEETRRKILEAAAGLFADKGYAGTTNADVAKRCGGVNPALINYYFRDKSTLYQEAWQFAYDHATRNHPEADALLHASDGTPETRLRRIIEASLRRYATHDSVVNNLIHNELSQPTGLLTAIYARALKGIRTALCRVIRETVGEAVPEEEILLAAYSIMALLIIPIRKFQEYDSVAEASIPLASRIDHVCTFAEGGLAALKAKYGR